MPISRKTQENNYFIGKIEGNKNLRALREKVSRFLRSRLVAQAGLPQPSYATAVTGITHFAYRSFRLITDQIRKLRI